MAPFFLLSVAGPIGCATVPPPPARPEPVAIHAPSPAERSPVEAPPLPGPAPAPEDAHARAPEDALARAQAHLRSGQALIARGEMAAAAASLREALGVRPDMTEARASLGRALYGMGDFDGAIDELRAVLRQDPEAVRARLALAVALTAKQDWVGSRAELEEVLRRQPDLLEAHYGLGAVRYALGDLDGAIDAYRRVLARDPAQHDARYSLALMLKLAHRDADATGEFLAAAEAGVPKAQYFVGAAYAAGLGVDRNVAQAIAWWFRAADQGVAQADEALGQLRQVALGKGRRGPAERRAVEQAFRDFRADLWKQFPGVARDGDDTVGAALLRDGRAAEGVPVLIREASALSEPAQRQLETVYERGVDGRLAAHDPRILEYFKMAAAEGQLRARMELARIYARGLGVPQDVGRAIGLLRATPHEDAQRLLQELSAAGGPASTRP